MQKIAFNCNNFSGINRTKSAFISNYITASDIQNIELFSTEINSGIGIRTSKGNESICELIPKDEKIINMFESIQKGNSYFFIHTENSKEGKIYLFYPNSKRLDLKVNNLSITNVSSGTDVSQGWSDLWVFSNSIELLSIEIGHYNEESKLDKIKMIQVKDTSGRSVKGLGLVNFAGRLWIFENHILRYSAQENIYDFSTSNAELSTSAGYIEFLKDITAIHPYLGSLAVFHADSSSLITKNENNSKISKTMDFPGGCASYQALVFHGTELYFYDDTKKGIFSFKQIINGNQTLGENIALDIQEELFSIKTSDLKFLQALSVVTSERNEVWFLIPDNNNAFSIILIYDYLRKCWVKRKSQKLNCIKIINGTLYSAGKKIYEEYKTNTFDGIFIPAYYKCTPLNLGKEDSLKIISYPPKVTLDMNYNNSFWVKYVKNYNSLTAKIRYIKTKSLKKSLYFDIGKWDYNFFATKDINSLKNLPTCFFKTLEISFLTKNENDDFCIKNIEFRKIKMKNI